MVGANKIIGNKLLFTTSNACQKFLKSNSHTWIIWGWSGYNKENNVFKDALGVKGLGFKHHGNHPGNHGSHYGNHHGNYHDNHSNHHGSYHAEQLLFCLLYTSDAADE